MRDADIRPDHFTLPLINRAISPLDGGIRLAESIHGLGIRMGFDSDAYFCNTAIEMYVRCVSVGSARHLFDEMRERDVVAWTSMISGYVQTGDISESVRLFNKMRMDGLEPSSVTLAVVLRACGVADDGDGCKQLLCFAVKSGLDCPELVQNSVLTVFIKVGCFQEAAKLFDGMEKRSVVSWNIMMVGYLSTGEVSQVVDCFKRMKAELQPSHETLTMVISAFAKYHDLLRGQKVHAYAIKMGQIDAILQCSLIDFYSKCGELASSIQLFEQVQAKKSSAWSVMMSGYIWNEQFSKAIDLFQRMQNAGFQCSADTLHCLVLAYTRSGSLLLGKGVHGYSIKNMLVHDSTMNTMATSILNMYVKCGNIVLARKCFDQMTVKDLVAWSSMIEGCAVHGLGLEALELFYQMQERGIKPNSVTFLSLLSACSHSGLVSEGCEMFDCMTRTFEIKPDLDHYTCMVDLLGRSGKLQEALGMIETMTVEADGRIWGALLASCRVYSDSRLGAFAAHRLFDLEADDTGYHVLLSNMHTSNNKWDAAENIRSSMGEKDYKKSPGWSCIEVKGVVHMFVAGDRSHSQVEDIYEVLGCLIRPTEEAICLRKTTLHSDFLMKF